MEEIDLDRWSEFQGALEQVEERIAEHTEAVKAEMLELFGRETSLSVTPSKTLLRGQQNAEWRLDTTLERQTGEERNSMSLYLSTILGLKSEIETYTGETWAIPTGVMNEVAEGLDLHRADPITVYEYGVPAPSRFAPTRLD